MPDRYGDDDPFAAILDSRPLGADELERSAERILRGAEVERCQLCNSEGYRGSMVCDHIDHTEAARRGMTMIRETMGWQQ